MTTFTKDSQGRWVLPKDPNAVLDYTFDWTRWLAGVDDTIASHTIVLAGGTTIVKDSSTDTDYAVTAFISGGTVGALEPVTCRIVTTGGRTDDRTVYLSIVQR